MAAPARVAVLASGGGSNLQALLAYGDALGAHRPYDVVLVASDRASCGATDRAAARGLALAHLGDPADADALLAALRAHDVALVVLAGYLKLVPADVTGRSAAPGFTFHPCLRPPFGGPGLSGPRGHGRFLTPAARVGAPRWT